MPQWEVFVSKHQNSTPVKVEFYLWLSIDGCLEVNIVNPSIRSVDLGSTVPFAGSLSNSLGQHGETPEPVLVAQLCLTLCDPMYCSPPGSSVHGILKARILEWIAISFSRGSSQPRDQTQVSCIAGRFFTI